MCSLLTHCTMCFLLVPCVLKFYSDACGCEHVKHVLESIFFFRFHNIMLIVCL